LENKYIPVVKPSNIVYGRVLKLKNYDISWIQKMERKKNI